MLWGYVPFHSRSLGPKSSKPDFAPKSWDIFHILLFVGRWRLKVYIHHYLGKFDHDLTVRPNPGIMVNKRNHPKMAEVFRWVRHYHLPRQYDMALMNMSEMITITINENQWELDFTWHELAAASAFFSGGEKTPSEPDPSPVPVVPSPSKRPRIYFFVAFCATRCWGTSMLPCRTEIRCIIIFFLWLQWMIARYYPW